MVNLSHKLLRFDLEYQIALRNQLCFSKMYHVDLSTRCTS